MNTTHSFIIGEYTVIPEENSIRLADNEKMLVQAKIMEVLGYLANSYPRLVSRSELIDSIWSGNYPVGEKTLTNAIWRLRQILKQNTDSHIETVRKSGYRLLIQPEYINNTEHSPSLLISPEGSNFTQNKYKYWLFTTIVIITLMFGYLLTINTEKSEIIIENLNNLIIPSFPFVVVYLQTMQALYLYCFSPKQYINHVVYFHDLLMVRQ